MKEVIGFGWILGKVEKFDFPFIIAVKGLNRSDIIKSMKNRVKNNYQEEFSTAINEVHKIAKIRLDALEF